MGPETLAQVVRPISDLFTEKDHPELLVGLAVSDDAAVYKVSDDVAMIHTLDFFTPIVDDPYDFGAIAAANSLSDVYAMGGRVTVALNICGFPSNLPTDMISEILRGGADKVKESGGVLAGGHTIVDKEPKYGLSVNGIVHPDKILAKAHAQPGDILVLSKGIGVGVIAHATKKGNAQSHHIAQASESMKSLNRKAAEIYQKVGVRACTDITGFALLGHSHEIAVKSGVKLHIDSEKVPLLNGVRTYGEQGIFPGGTFKNRDCYSEGITFHHTVSEESQNILYTPETSGGLIASVHPDKVDQLLKEFDQAEENCWVIGSVSEGSGIEVK